MLDRENCVDRLRALAEKLAQFPEGDVQEILAQVLGADPTTMEFHRRLADFEDLAKRAREQVAELTNDANYDLYMKVMDQIISKIEELNMRDNWTRYKDPFNQRAMGYLETCARIVESRLTTAQPSEEAIREALVEVQEAISTIRDADIDAEAKQLLLELLREAEHALLSYHISGLTDLRRSVERMVGAYFLHKDIVDRNSGHGAVERFWRAFSRVVMLVQMFYLIKQLTGADVTVPVRMLVEKLTLQ